LARRVSPSLGSAHRIRMFCTTRLSRSPWSAATPRQRGAGVRTSAGACAPSLACLGPCFQAMPRLHCGVRVSDDKDRTRWYRIDAVR
jgi:hypothetical protein